MPTRKGLDPEVIQFLKDVDAAFRDMRLDIGALPGDDDVETDAVGRYLVYLSILVDVVLASLAMNAVHGNDLVVLMLQRLLVEYAAKGMYYEQHPDFAVFMIHINEADSVAQRAKDGGMTAERVAEFKSHAATVRKRYSAYAKVPGVTVRHMIETVAKTEDWAWLYAAPSVLLHGEPEGIRTVYEFTDGGAQPRINLSDASINAHLVDAGMNTLTFCRAFNSAFHPGNVTLGNRFNTLETKGRRLALKHDHGRDAEALSELRKDPP